MSLFSCGAPEARLSRSAAFSKAAKATGPYIIKTAPKAKLCQKQHFYIYFGRGANEEFATPAG